MKITIDFPDTSICAVINFIRVGVDGFTMQSHSISSAKMKDGAAIKIKEEAAIKE